MINQENTYLGADGLAYCKICGEPVEAFFPPDSILGMKKHFRQCACIRQKREVEEGNAMGKPIQRATEKINVRSYFSCNLYIKPSIIS